MRKFLTRVAALFLTAILAFAPPFTVISEAGRRDDVYAWCPYCQMTTRSIYGNFDASDTPMYCLECGRYKEVTPTWSTCSTPSLNVYGSYSYSSYPYITWSSVTGAKSYTVYVGGSTYSTTSTSYSLSWLPLGSTYYVQIMAVGDSDQYYYDSGWSTSQSVCNMYHYPISAPSTTLTALSDSSIKVEWSNVSGASSYTLQYSTNSSYTDAQTVSITGIEYTITELSPNTTYYVRVKSNTTQSDRSNSGYTSKSIKTLQYPLSGVEDIKLTILDCNSIGISFTAVERATGYAIEYSTNSEFSNKKTLIA